MVRLNPNLPWKTRGNGAVSIKTGKGKGKKIKIGEFKDKNIYSYCDSKKTFLESEKIKDFLKKIICEHAKFNDVKTNPGLVIFQKKPDHHIYSKAVRKEIQIEEIKKYLTSKKVFFKGYKNKRGLIGATAATAWKNNSDKTYELISYRKKEKWGKKRFVDDKTTKNMDKQFDSIFDNYDYQNNYNSIVPNSPCPVLYGIRGEKTRDLIKANSMIKSEKKLGWIIFETNQGTDDHLQKKKISEIKGYQSVIVEGKVCKKPYTIEGGHVFFKIKNSTGSIDCAAYEPTKKFRNTIRKLTIGDQVKIFGGVRKKPLTINIEKIFVKNLAEKKVKIENPICPICKKHMKSIGKNKGYRCKKCKTKESKPVMEKKPRAIKKGFYEVPVSARRHLSKPLKRI
ncbi:MAG: tRNA(Ile)(2)-agmatinylcytidine synthase [Candidatus Thermoplasmatota archaeon]